jgi:hypothetical protein
MEVAGVKGERSEPVASSLEHSDRGRKGTNPIRSETRRTSVGRTLPRHADSLGEHPQERWVVMVILPRSPVLWPRILER